MENDWRLTNQLEYLFSKTLKKAVYAPSGSHDHAHCEFCFSKFGAGEHLLKTGYCTMDGYHWICNQCFYDFRQQFQWRLKSEASKAGDGSLSERQGDGSVVSSDESQVDPK